MSLHRTKIEETISLSLPYAILRKRGEKNYTAYYTSFSYTSAPIDAAAIRALIRDLHALLAEFGENCSCSSP